MFAALFFGAVEFVLAAAVRLGGGVAAGVRWLARTLLASPHAAAGLLLGLGAAGFWFPGLAWYAAVFGLPAAAGLLLWHDSLGPPPPPRVGDDFVEPT